jgi:hypothetical protein
MPGREGLKLGVFLLSGLKLGNREGAATGEGRPVRGLIAGRDGLELGLNTFGNPAKGLPFFMPPAKPVRVGVVVGFEKKFKPDKPASLSIPAIGFLKMPPAIPPVRFPHALRPLLEPCEGPTY